MQLDQAKSLTDQLDEAEKYIKKLQGKLEKMKEKRERLMRDNPNARLYGGLATRAQIEIHESGDALVLNLVTDLECEFMFNETIRMCHERRVGYHQCKLFRHREFSIPHYTLQGT